MLIALLIPIEFFYYVNHHFEQFSSLETLLAERSDTMRAILKNKQERKCDNLL
jgi:hypothetical protein